MSQKSTVFPDPSVGGRTRQSEASSCDVNQIVNTFRRTGIVPAVINRVAEYGYVPATDFRECMQQIREAKEVFAALPSKTREYFANDPARFLDYIKDPKRKEELLEHKLLIPKPKPGPALGSEGNPIHVAGSVAGETSPD